MRVHILQHVPFEWIGSMAPVLECHGIEPVTTRLFCDEPMPSAADFDLLIVMGGPMGVHDDDRCPWLPQEKQTIEKAISHGRRVLGICLGAQLIAHVLGARVTRNKHREIGWFDIRCDSALKSTILADTFPDVFEAFHWHGDTFDLPDGTVPLGSSEACINQGFILDDRVVGFQFHLETTRESATGLITNCRDELDGSLYVQNEETILMDDSRFYRANLLLNNVLNALLDT